jgi:hypothetical protein
MSRRYRLICFDEFHVADVTDAMILHRLLESLFENRVVHGDDVELPAGRPLSRMACTGCASFRSHRTDEGAGSTCSASTAAPTIARTGPVGQVGLYQWPLERREQRRR